MELEFDKDRTDDILDLAKKIQVEATRRCRDFDEMFDSLDNIKRHANTIIDYAVEIRKDCPSPPHGLARFKYMESKDVWVEA